VVIGAKLRDVEGGAADFEDDDGAAASPPYRHRRAQLVASAVVGAGEGLRLAVEPQPEAGLPGHDSVTAGPVVLGPGLGALYHLGHHAALVADLPVPAGLPTSPPSPSSAAGSRWRS
jgi:hypothetical protein